MKKQPKLILRESAVFDMTRHLPPGSFVEMGAGTGHMASLFLDRGFHGTCHDLGDSSRELIRKRFTHCPDLIKVVDNLSELTPNSYDYLLAFEVLEHIEDDKNVLSDWIKYLKPGGTFIASVPAHQRKFGPSDYIVGHVRRYEKFQILDLLKHAGIQEIKIINYGFPITEISRTISNRMVASDNSYDNLTQTERSIASAQTQPQAVKKMLSRISGKLVTPFCQIQKLFYSLDLGDGFIMTGKKS